MIDFQETKGNLKISVERPVKILISRASEDKIELGVGKRVDDGIFSNCGPSLSNVKVVSNLQRCTPLQSSAAPIICRFSSLV
jgi:hypothetical protein